MSNNLHYKKKIISHIPPEWGKARVDENLVENLGGFSCAKRHAVPSGIPHLRPMNITTSGDIIFTDDTVNIPLDFHRGIEGYYLQKWDVLYNNTNSVELVGKTGIVRKDMAVAFSNHINRFRVRDSDQLDPRWLALALRNYQYQGLFTANCNKWIGQAGFSISELAKLEIPLPDISIQRRIVARIEVVMGEVREMRDLSKAIQADTNRLMDAVYEDAYPDQHGQLPDGWEVMVFPQVCEINPRRPRITRDPNESTSFVPMEAVDDVTGSIPVLRTRPYSNVRSGYRYFEDNDVLFAKITPSMQNGKAAIAIGLIDGFGLGSTEFHIFRPNDGILSEWIYHYIRRSRFRNEAMQRFRGAAGQQRVPQDFLESQIIPVPFPNDREKSLEIQKKIVAYFENVKTEILEMLEISRLDILHLEQMEQAILAQAFSGTL